MANSVNNSCIQTFIDGSSIEETIIHNQRIKILIVGCGGIGSSVIKKLCKFPSIELHVVDMDIIEISNLNRQLFCTKRDVGRSKVEIIVEKISNCFPECRIIGYCCRIEECSKDFFVQFEHVFLCLDDLSCRMWVNRTLCQIHKSYSGKDYIERNFLSLFDLGSNGIYGHVIHTELSILSPCLQCFYDLYEGDNANNIDFYNRSCTLAGIPRTAVHCVLYAYGVELYRWYSEQKEKKLQITHSVLDPFTDECVNIVLELARTKAGEFGIDGVTETLVKLTIRRPIPAIHMVNNMVSNFAVRLFSRMIDKLYKSSCKSFKSNNVSIFMSVDISSPPYSSSCILDINSNCQLCNYFINFNYYNFSSYLLEIKPNDTLEMFLLKAARLANFLPSNVRSVQNKRTLVSFFLIGKPGNSYRHSSISELGICNGDYVEIIYIIKYCTESIKIDNSDIESYCDFYTNNSSSQKPFMINNSLSLTKCDEKLSSINIFVQLL